MAVVKNSKPENAPSRGVTASRSSRGFVLHFRPKTVPEPTLKLTFTWGLGGSAVVLILLLIGTGLLLKFVYQPVPELAYASILVLQHETGFGSFIRSLHHWSANILVVVVFLHMLRVFFTGAFQQPRQLTWFIGLGLSFLILVANFTGYLLPYDQLAYWAVTVSTGMLDYIPIVGAYLQELIRGGPAIGPATLSIFYALHTAAVPICLVTLMAFHFWRIRKARGLVIPHPPGSDYPAKFDRVPVMPELLLRELVTAVVVIAAVMIMSAFWDAPLQNPANPGLSPNPTKAPWYFAGFQELLLHIHPVFSVFVIPVLFVGSLLLYPYIVRSPDTAGIWFVSGDGRKMAAIASLTAMVVTPLLIVINAYVLPPDSMLPQVPPIISSGLLPFIFIGTAIAIFYQLLKRTFSATTAEALQTIFVLLVTAFAVMTVIGIWFRGPGMQLVWPGQ
jgi:quinol-cytochrome oxidoreductase complex cytochrome b subunit